MTRQYIPFLAFIILLLLTIPGWFDFSTSVVPGWHTTIFPPLCIPMMVTPPTDDGNPPLEKPLSERAFCAECEDNV